MHDRLLGWPGDDGSIDGFPVSVDSVAVPAKRGSQLTGPNPVDRGKARSNYHMLTGAGGLPLSITLSAANTYDALLLEPLIEAVPAIVGPRGRPGRPRRRPAQLEADNGDDYPRCRPARRHHGTDRPPQNELQPRLGRHR